MKRKHEPVSRTISLTSNWASTFRSFCGAQAKSGRSQKADRSAEIGSNRFGQRIEEFYFPLFSLIVIVILLKLILGTAQ